MSVRVNGYSGAIEGVSSFNGGSPTFRKIIINGAVNTINEINQRGKTISQVSDSEYFADRWRRVSSTTMTQPIEEGSYRPNEIYTLSGTGVTTQELNPSWDLELGIAQILLHWFN